MLVLQQQCPELWKLVLRMNATQRDLLMRESIASLSDLIATQPELAEAAAMYLNTRPTIPGMTDRLVALADEMDDRAKGRFTGEPQSTWLTSFRFARCAQAILALIRQGVSNEGADASLYEFAHSRWPEQDAWLTQIAVIARQMLETSTTG